MVSGEWLVISGVVSRQLSVVGGRLQLLGGS